MMTEQNKDIRDIDSFDTVTNLQALIADDLKKQGVKIPQRRDLSSMRAPPTEAQKVQHFKNYLGYVPCYYLEPFGHVPSFLVRAATIIEQNIFVEGIFRKSGSVSRQKKVEEEIEKECDVSSANVFDITSLIKQFFRELREPLLTHLYHDSFLKCLQLWNNNNSNSSSSSSSSSSSEVAKTDECPIVKLCLLLPPEHLSTLRFTMNMFSKIAAASDQNKMNVRNLSLVMAPSIMHSYNKGEKVTGMEEKMLPLQTSLLELLISEEKKLGLVSAGLYERAETMTACFGNVMEPEITNVKTAASGHKKKERRSGSLQGIVSTIAQSITRWHRSGSNNNSRSSLSHSSPDLTKITESASSTPFTPVILGKRKAPIDGTTVGLSSSKRKAGIIGQQPLLPNTPSSKKMTSRNKDVPNLYDSKPSIHTPRRIKTPPTKKPKRKPFFQVLCSSKNSKKIENTKPFEPKPKEPSSQEFVFCRGASVIGKGSRRRKRSASPFRRFMKRKKSENLMPPASPSHPAKERSSRHPRRSSTGSCYSPHPATTASVFTGFAESRIPPVPHHSTSVTKDVQKQNDVPTLASECSAGNKHTLTSSVVKESLLAKAEISDSELSDDGFSTISGGTVIFVEKKTETSKPPVFSASNRTISTSINNKYDLKPCNHDSIKTRSQSTERRPSLHSIQDNMNNGPYKAKKRSYSAADTKIVHRPMAVASLRVMGETKKILQRAQVPDKCLIQPAGMMYCSSPVTTAGQKKLQRASSVNESFSKRKVKAMPSRLSSSLVCGQASSATPKQKSFSPAVSKADVLLRRFNQQEAEDAARNNPNTSEKVSSPQWTRHIDAHGQPCLYKNISQIDCISVPTPTKRPRLRRVSSPLSISKSEVEGASVFDNLGNRRHTEYKQMIKACLNSPNLYKGVMLDNMGESYLRTPSVYKRRHRSLDGVPSSNVAAIRQRFVLKEFEKREKLRQKNVSTSPQKVLELFTETQTITLEKENSVFLSPAPILKYRKELLPMAKVNVEKDPSPRQVLHDCNKDIPPASQNAVIKTPASKLKSIHIKPALTPTPVKIKHQIVDRKINTPLKAIHRPRGLFGGQTSNDTEI